MDKSRAPLTAASRAGRFRSNAQTRLGSTHEEAAKARSQEISTLHQEIVGHLKSSLEKAVKIGELLTVQKSAIKHGEFTLWLKMNIPFTERTARNYMRLYRARDKLKAEIVSDLNQAYGFLKQLTWSGPRESRTGDKEFILTLRIDDVGRDIIMSAVDMAKELLDTDSVSRAIEYIAGEWHLATADVEDLPPFEVVVAWVERAYRVKIKIRQDLRP